MTFGELSEHEPEETNERFVYLVRSDHNPRLKYRVDLTANGGAGFCQCKNFAVKKQSAIDRGLPIITFETTCKHTRSCFVHLLRIEMPGLAAKEDQT